MTNGLKGRNQMKRNPRIGRFLQTPILLFVDNEQIPYDSIDVEIDTRHELTTIIADNGGIETEIIADSKFVTRKLSPDNKSMIIMVDSSNKVP